MKFWGVEVKAGQTLKVSPGERNVIHLSQAAIGETYNGMTESVPLYVKVGKQKLVIGTLSPHMFPQIQFDVVIDEDFELSHSSRFRSVFFCGYRAQNPEDDEIYSGDDFGSESEDEEFPIENVKPVPVKAAAKKQVLSGNTKVKINQNQLAKRPNAYSDEYSSDEDDYSDYDDENGKPEPLKAAATKQVPSSNSKVKINQHQLAKRTNAYSDEYSSDEDDFSDYDDGNGKHVKAAATKQVPSGNTKVKTNQNQLAKRPNAYSDEYSSDEDDYSDYDDENGKPEPMKAAATKQVPSGNSKVKIDQHQLAKRPNADPDSDEYDFSDSDDEDQSDYDDEDLDASSESDEEYEKIPIPKKNINKRPNEPASKTPVPPKKAAFATPQKSADVKKATATHTATPYPAKQAAQTPYPAKQAAQTQYPAKQAAETQYPAKQAIQTQYPAKHATHTPHPAKQAIQTQYPAKQATQTPHPAKQAAKTPKNENAKTPASGGKASCNSCNKTFNSRMALESHSKAKHAAARK